MIKLKCTDIDSRRFTYQNLAELKERYPDEENDTLARYLIANNDDITSTCTQLNKAISLREEYSGIKKASCFNEIAKGSAYLHGHDKEGRPLLIVHARMHDPDNRVLKESVLMTLWWTEQAIAQLPDKYSRFTILLDRDNCENAVDTEYMQALAEVFVHLHPERLHRAIVYPTGIVFYSMWNLIIKWFMAENTREKVFPAVSLGDLQALIDDRFIPASLGGSSQYVFDVEEFSDPPCLGGSSEKTTLSSTDSGGDAGEERNACGEGEQGDLNTSSNAGFGSLSFSVATTAESPDSAKHMPPVSLQEHSSAKQRPGLERRSGQRGLALQQQSNSSHNSLNSVAQHSSTEEGGMDTTEEVATAVVNSKEGGTEGRVGADSAEENDRTLVSPLSDECDVPAVLNYSQRENGECTEKQKQQVEREAEENRQTPLAAAAEELGEVEEGNNVWVEVSSQSGAEEEDDEEVVEGPAAGTVSGESYHYSARPSLADGRSVTSAGASKVPRPFPAIQDLSPVGTSRNSDFISAGSVEASEEGDCWQEVGSVDSGDGPAAEAAEEGAVAAVLNSEDSRAYSATVPVPTVVAAVVEKADALLTAYVHMSLSVLWCAAVALVVGAGLFSTYYPEAPSATVSVAFLARLTLFALLLCCFL